MESVALIVAAGRGVRMGAGPPKQYQKILGRHILYHSAAAFASHSSVDAVRAVIHADDPDLYAQATEGLRLLSPVTGGATRQQSVLLGLESLVDLEPRNVMIHDAARPAVPAAVIDRVLQALATSVAAIPALPVSDSLKRCADGIVMESVERANLWRAQTPQGFRFKEILDAHRAVRGRALTDDAAVVETAGIPVALVDGSEENLKVTDSDDMARAERALGGITRVGNGYDVHRFGPGDHVTLCGVRIPHDQGLIGHSDADVGFHALVDAVFGALGSGDIGSHFPSSDPTFRGVGSALFARHAQEMVTAAGGQIRHLDITVICERPRIGAFRDDMIASTAKAFSVPSKQVSIKATTTDGLGFTGRGEGIAGLAVATLCLPE